MAERAVAARRAFFVLFFFLQLLSQSATPGYQMGATMGRSGRLMKDVMSLTSARNPKTRHFANVIIRST